MLVETLPKFHIPTETDRAPYRAVVEIERSKNCAIVAYQSRMRTP